MTHTTRPSSATGYGSPSNDRNGASFLARSWTLRIETRSRVVVDRAGADQVVVEVAERERHPLEHGVELDAAGAGVRARVLVARAALFVDPRADDRVAGDVVAEVQLGPIERRPRDRRGGRSLI